MLAQLQRKILEGELTPGGSTTLEREMMETFGVSRPTIREALGWPRATGLITVRHGDGRPRVLGQPSGLLGSSMACCRPNERRLPSCSRARMVLEGPRRLAAARPVSDGPA